MNAVTKAVNYNYISLWQRSFAVTYVLPKIHVMVLLASILLTALSLVYIKDLNRRLFMDYQEQQQTAAQMNGDYSKLLLEQGAWSVQSRIQKVASNNLAMVMPQAKDIVVVRL